MCRILFSLAVLVGVAAAQDYDLPEPLIEVLGSGVLRVSIPDSPGIRNFKFEGFISGGYYYDRNIELESRRAEYGRWTVQDDSVILSQGDVINYVFIIRSDGAGYQSGHGQYVVPEITTNRYHPRPSGSYGGYIPTYDPPFPMYPNLYLGVPESTSTNMSETILALQAQIEALSANNTRLSKMIESCTGPNKIVLSGMILPSDDAKETVKFILREILYLQPNVTVAEKKIDGTIEFEVPTLVEKVAILDAADKKLTNSTIKFTSSI